MKPRPRRPRTRPLIRILIGLMTVLSLLPLALIASSGAANAVTATRATLTYNKNPTNPLDSRLMLRIYGRPDGGAEQLVSSRTWRAGSGTGSKNECATNRGWLPNGSYSMRMYLNYPGDRIRGRAFHLSNKQCNGGTTVRTELFIHTETGAGNVQCRDAPGDQNCRWDGNGDYASEGCIKLHPTHLKQLYDLTRQYFGTSGSGGRVPFSLRVVS